jgi:hypothetical protein
MWPAERRGLPLGVVGAVQELGSVLGPLYGAVVLARADWPAIFWINLGVAAALAAAVAASAVRGPGGDPASRTPPDLAGAALGLGATVALALVLLEPRSLTSGVTTGRAFIPYVADTRWTTPMAVTFGVLAAGFALRQATARRPLVSLRDLPELSSRADLAGAGLLALALAGVVVAFATADPEVQVFSPVGPWLLVGSAACAALFAWRQRTAAAPLIPRGSLRLPGAWGAMAVSLLVGASLVAALVDIPVFARLTTYPDSQLAAALVLVRLLAALPVGAVLGGYLLHRAPAAALASTGMLMAAVAFIWMAQWGRTALDDPTATAPLILCGLGFGLAIAPVNASLLASTRSEVHGVASALLVVARMVGMLVGLALLTEIGLRRFYALSDDLPPVPRLCGSDTLCDAYYDALKGVGVAQVHAIFWGAAVCALAAAALSAVLIRSATGADLEETNAHGLGL